MERMGEDNRWSRPGFTAQQRWPAVEAAPLKADTAKADLAAEALLLRGGARGAAGGQEAGQAQEALSGVGSYWCSYRAACPNVGASQFGVSWTQTLGADPLTVQTR